MSRGLRGGTGCRGCGRCIHVKRRASRIPCPALSLVHNVAILLWCRFHEYYDDIMKYYRLEHKDGQGRSTGWPALDQLYKVVPGELTIVTGVPNSGKSEWIDSLLANLAEQHDWCFALCSMEKKVGGHAQMGGPQGQECARRKVMDPATSPYSPLASTTVAPLHRHTTAGHRPCAPACGEVHRQAVFRPALCTWRAANERA